MRIIPLMVMLMFAAASSSTTYVRNIGGVEVITLSATAPTDCDNPVQRHYELARELELLGTPAVLTEDGRVMYGAPSAQQILGLSGLQDDSSR